MRGDGEDADAHRKFYDEYNSVMDLPADYYLDTINMVFLEQHLPHGKLMVNGKSVRPEAIRDTALFTIEGELDDISPPGQTRAAHELCSRIPAHERQHLTVKGVAHFGLFAGKRFRDEVYPHIRDFIHKHA